MPPTTQPPVAAFPSRTIGFWPRLVGAALSVAVLAALYQAVDLRATGAALHAAAGPWLYAAVGMIVPLTLLRAFRFLRAAPPGSLPAYAEAFRLTLASAALNLFMPAKSGDLLKSYVIGTRGGASAGVAVSVIVYERLCDLLGLFLWCVVGWILSTPRASALAGSATAIAAVLAGVLLVLVSSERGANALVAVATRPLRGRGLDSLRRFAEGWPALHRSLGARRAEVIGLSLLMWFLNLTQIWMFTVALALAVPFAVCLNLAAFALAAGQVPFTFAGLGPRDVAFVVLFATHGTPEAAAAVGLLSSSRLFLPALAALPILRPYVAAVASTVATWRPE